MKANDLTSLLNLPNSTLHKYVKDYAEYLSPSGVGGAGRHREYTEQDARILKLILDMKAERVSSDNIEVTLSSLRDGNWSQLPALDQATQGIIPTQANQVAAQMEISALEREVTVWRGLYENATSDRDELLRKLSEAETMLKLYESGRLKPQKPD